MRVRSRCQPLPQLSDLRHDPIPELISDDGIQPADDAIVALSTACEGRAEHSTLEGRPGWEANAATVVMVASHPCRGE